MTVKLRAVWSLPAGSDAAESDGCYRSEHLPHVRSLPALRGHTVLRFTADARGSHARWYRGEELWFPDQEAAVQSTSSLDWSYLCSPLWALVSGPRIDLLSIEDVFVGEPEGEQPQPSSVACLTGFWQVPPETGPGPADEVYFRAHVPGVRALPGLQRHTVMKALSWPPGEHARFWRGAEIRFACGDSFAAAYDSPEYEAVRRDGFNAAVVGPEVDSFVIEEEWFAGGLA